MKFISLLTFASIVLCRGKNIRIYSGRSGQGLVGSSSSCSVSISNKDTGETLDLRCSMYGFGQISCNTESKNSSLGNYDARIMDCGNDSWNMHAKVAVYDKIGDYMEIKEFQATAKPDCGHTLENTFCQSNWVIDEFWPEA